MLVRIGSGWPTAPWLGPRGALRRPCRLVCSGSMLRGPSHGAVGQPDPMRTSIDLMGKGGGGGRNRNRSGGGGGGGYGGNRSGGGGGGGNRRGGFSR